MAKFKPLSRLDYESWIERRYQALRLSRRGRPEPLLLLFYGAIIPAIYAVKEMGQSDVMLLLLWTWGVLTVIACLFLAFAETNADRAARYAKWLAKYEADLAADARDDEREAPKRKAAYEKALAQFRTDHPGFLG